MNVIVSIVITIIFLSILKEIFTLHMGYVAYSNYPYVVLLISYLTIIVMLLTKDIIDISALGVFLGAILYIIALRVINARLKKIELKADEEYKKKREISIDNIDYEKLKKLIRLNQLDGIENYGRVCNCLCKFSDRQINSDECSLKDFSDDINAYFSNDECLTLTECCNSRCSVFNTIVDFVTYDSRDTQKGMCLLRQCKTNRELKDLVEKAVKEINNEQ